MSKIVSQNPFIKDLGVMNAIRLEAMVFSFADQILPNYSGGQWEFIKTEDAAYMRYPFDGKQNLCFGYNEASLSCDATGIAITLIALSGFSFYLNERNMDADSTIAQFYALREYALEHQEAQGIFRLID